MEDDRPDAKSSKRAMRLIILGTLVFNVLIAAYVQIATARWSVTLAIFVGLLLIDAIGIFPFFWKNRSKPERYGGV